jgi:hypothetical protein
MASIINASTAGVGGVITTADNSGVLNIQTGGTTAVTIDASGNLLVGGTTSATRLNVIVNSATAYSTTNIAGYRGIYLDNQTGGGFSNITLNTVDATAAANCISTISCISETSGSRNAALTFATRTHTTGAVIERMRIDSSGNLNVGTTGVNTNAIQQNTNAATSTLQVIAAQSTTGNQYGIYVSLNGDPNNTTNYFMANRGAGSTDRCTIRSNGGIANYSANNVNLSDRREKTNFAPAGDYLDKICAIPVQTFNYNDQNLEEDDGLTLGVVAQDVQAVCPEMVMESNWAGEDEPEKLRLSVYQTDLQYALMKSIQELKAIVDTQAEQIKALQGAK